MADSEVRVDRDVLYRQTGVPMKVDIYRPASARQLPVLLMVHGGGWCVGSKEAIEHESRLMVAAGYVAVAVGYRLAPGHPYPAACEDVRDAAAWTSEHIAEYGGDPARIGAYGSSAGAHLVAWLAGQPNTSLRCVVAWAGPTDMLKEPVTRPYRGYSLGFMNGCEHEVADAYRAASPVTHVHAGMVPLLLIHGKADVIVPPAHAQYMLDAARRVGAPVQAMLLDGVGHSGGSPNVPAEQPGWQAMMRFYDEHLHPAAK